MKTSKYHFHADSNRAIFYLTVAAWFAILLVYYYVVQGYPEKDLVDTDAFTRLVRVEQLAADRDWFDSLIPRSNAPYGETLHWTRALDILLLLGAGLLTPLLGFHKALYWWGIVISPILGVFSLAAIAWAARPVLDEEKRRLLWLIFLGQFLLVSVYHFGRPDHHSLLALLFIGLLGCLLRLVLPAHNRPIALWAGLLAGIAVWVSVEALTGVVLVFATLTLLWITQGEGYRLKLAGFAWSLLLSSCLFVLLEHRPALLLQFEYDRISAVHIIVFLLAALSVWFLRLFSRQAVWKRSCAAVSIALVDGLILWLTVPAFIKGPFSQVNPAIAPIWLNWVIEVQPLMSESTTTKVAVIGSILLALGFILWQFAVKTRDYRTEHLLTCMLGLLLFIPLTFYQIRWVYYCSALLIFPLTMFLGQVLAKVSEIRGSSLRVLTRAITIFLFLFGFLFLGLLLEGPADDSAAATPKTGLLCDWLNDPDNNLPASAVILIDMDYGPEVLYRTPHQVIATPYHRNDDGILFNHRVMTAANAGQAYSVISERQVDLVVLTPKSSEKVIYGAGENPGIFYNQLLDGQIPEWLVPVQTTEQIQEWFVIFRVVT